MRKFAIATATVVGLLFGSAVQADEAAARDVIVAQLDAFQRDDFEEAFTYASPTVQQIFRTPQRFAAMVRGGYPMVWRPSSVRFGLSEAREDKFYQQVVLGGSNGRLFLAEYEFIETDGVWQINGVRLLPDAGVGA